LEIIETSQSWHSTTLRWVVPGRTASWERGRLAVVPSTPPPSRRKSSTACSGRTMSESPMISRTGLSIEEICSSDQPSNSMSSRLHFPTSPGQFSGSGATSL
jgi:hypothetical protein